MKRMKEKRGKEEEREWVGKGGKTEALEINHQLEQKSPGEREGGKEEDKEHGLGASSSGQSTEED